MKESRSPLQSTSFLLSKLGMSATARFGEKVAALGLKPNLAGLLAAAAENPDHSQLELGRFLGVGPSALVPLIDELERRGLVRRMRSNSDRRRQEIQVTGDGVTAIAQTAQLAQEVDQELLGTLAPEEFLVLHTLLRRLADVSLFRT